MYYMPPLFEMLYFLLFMAAAKTSTTLKLFQNNSLLALLFVLCRHDSHQFLVRERLLFHAAMNIELKCSWCSCFWKKTSCCRHNIHHLTIIYELYFISAASTASNLNWYISCGCAMTFTTLQLFLSLYFRAAAMPGSIHIFRHCCHQDIHHFTIISK